MIGFHIFFIVASDTFKSISVLEIYKKDLSDKEELTITACSGTFQYDLSIFDVKSTRFEARNRCLNKGFPFLVDAKAKSLRWDHIRTHLQELRREGINTSTVFWTGLFRSEKASDVWYQFKNFGNCREFSGEKILQGNVSHEHLCSIIEFDIVGDSQVLKGAFCNQSLPYICRYYHDQVVFHSYTGVSHISQSLPGFVLEKIQLSISESSCLEECLSNVICNALTYNYTSEMCIMLKSTFINGASRYTITRVYENVTHFAKAECNVFYQNVQSVHNPDVKEEFPVCVQADQCSCNTSNSTDEEIIAIIEEHIRNLMIDPKKTSAHYRTLTCAADHRTSSRVLGTFGILCLTVAFSIPLTLDILKCFNNVTRNIRRELKCNNKRTEQNVFGKA